LQRQVSLIATGGGNDSFADFHGWTPGGAGGVFFMTGKTRA
jgi:hypothetical protein